MNRKLSIAHYRHMLCVRIIQLYSSEKIFVETYRYRGMHWHSWLRHCATSRKVAGRFLMVSLEFFIDIIRLAALWPWG